MEKVDIKDKKIIFHLLQNSRQPLSKIGKNVRQSKELVSYRVKRLQEKQIIKKFTTMTDASKFGIIVAPYYYKFDNINPSIRKEITKFLVNSKFTRYVSSTEGKYDMVVWYYIVNINIFINFYENLLRNYRQYFSTQIFPADLGVEIFHHDFLLSENKRPESQIISKKSASEWLPMETIDVLDITIIKELSNNPRIKIIEIANKTDTTVNTIKNRINKLLDNEVIFGFSTLIDWVKMGYRYYTLEFYLHDYSKKSKIVNYLKMNPHLVKIYITYCYGVDIKCDLILHDIDQLRNIMEDITNKFPNSIKNIDYFNTYKIDKLDHLPPI